MRRILSFPIEETGGEAEAMLRFMAALLYYDGWLDCSQIVLVGDEAQRARYLALLKRELEQVKGEQDKKARMLKRMVYLQEETDTFSLGGMLQAMVLMGQLSGILALTSAPKALFLSHGGESWCLLDPDTTLFGTHKTLDLSETHRDPSWYRGMWKLYECGSDLVPEELSQFMIEIKGDKPDAGAVFSLDIEPSLDSSLRMDFGNAHRKFNTNMFPMIEKEKKSESADTEQETSGDSSAEQLILKLLPIVDSLEYGVRSIQPDDDNPHAQGLIRILR